MANTSWNQWKHSIVKEFNVTQIPVKPFVPRDVDPHMNKVLKESKDGVAHFMPVEMNELNVGSNRGLLKLIQQFADARDARLRRGGAINYQVFTADCNIFMRMLKVCRFVHNAFL